MEGTAAGFFPVRAVVRTGKNPAAVPSIWHFPCHYRFLSGIRTQVRNEERFLDEDDTRRWHSVVLLCTARKIANICNPIRKIIADRVTVEYVFPPQLDSRLYRFRRGSLA